jgi:hypothetical protein
MEELLAGLLEQASGAKGRVLACSSLRKRLLLL